MGSRIGMVRVSSYFLHFLATAVQGGRPQDRSGSFRWSCWSSYKPTQAELPATLQTDVCWAMAPIRLIAGVGALAGSIAACQPVSRLRKDTDLLIQEGSIPSTPTKALFHTSRCTLISRAGVPAMSQTKCVDSTAGSVETLCLL